MIPSIVSTFFPPELAVQEDLISEDAFHSGRDMDQLSQVYFQRLRSPKREPALDRELVAQVLAHARKIIAHPSKPLIPEQASFFEKPFQELALEETLEDNPLLSHDAPIWVEGTRPKPFSCVAMLDCSASMSGDKHLLGAVAAIGQKDIKRLMAYSSIAHMGYALIGLSVGLGIILIFDFILNISFHLL